MTPPNLEMEQALDRRVLAALFDANGKMHFPRLRETVQCTERELFRSLNRQYRGGNVQRHYSGQAIQLTAAAKLAIGAGRGGASAQPSNLRASSLPVSEATIKAACAPPRPKSPLPSDDFLRSTDTSREAAIRRATHILALRIAQFHPERMIGHCS